MKFRILSALLVLGSLSACSQPLDSPESTYFRMDSRVAQDWALRDGDVTEVEYQTAVDGFLSCMAHAGYNASEPALSPVDGLTLLFDVEPSGDPNVWNTKVEECNLTHISDIEPAYVEANTQVMDARLREVAVKCLEEKGVALTGVEQNVTELVKSAEGSMQMVMGCVGPALRTLYPDLPTTLKVRW
ncbi:hypothetical protein [Micromonospora sp. LOL_015]|uniref:hypothetical protein n=1 Tax=Micromonospora sp. LOL_015 TaxID=3345416 RepID=UPI003A860332